MNCVVFQQAQMYENFVEAIPIGGARSPMTTKKAMQVPARNPMTQTSTASFPAGPKTWKASVS